MQDRGQKKQLIMKSLALDVWREKKQNTNIVCWKNINILT